MPDLALQSDRSVHLERLSRRVAELGLTLLCIESDGHIEPQVVGQWIDEQIIESALFARDVRLRWPELSQIDSELLEVWPGVRLAPLPVRGDKKDKRWVALFVGSSFLDSDQWREVCECGHMDPTYASTHVEREALLNRAQAHRLTVILAWMALDVMEAEQARSDLQTMSCELGESYEELSLLYKLSSNMVVNQPPAAFLSRACRELNEVAGFGGVAILLIEDEPRLKDLAAQGFSSGSFAAIAPDQMGLIGRHLVTSIPNDGQPWVVDDTAKIGVFALARFAANALVAPLRSDRKILGFIIGGGKNGGEQISSVDAKLFGSLADSISVFLENVMLYDDMQLMFLGTLHALTAAIDAKDSYTHGHSERVALMSRLIARRAGFDDMLVERMYLAGLVHDLGKIGVPESVLCKTGRLSAAEFDQIKRHPEIGARILHDIHHMADLVPGVLYHHERWDGDGYPHGLARTDIPLMGRVIGLADAFDAMSSDRTYRQAMRPDQVLAEIKQCTATQFDPDLTKVFAMIDFSPFYELVGKHQELEVRRTA